MKRTHILAAIVLTGAVATGWESLGAMQAPGAQGGRPGGPGGAPQQLGMIQKVTENVYMIPGNGGNSTVFVASNGVVLVDTKLANNGQGLLERIKSVTDKPITTIINTHTHGDHNGSNQFFPATVDVIAHENTKTNMQKMDAFKEPANAHGLPDRTFKDRMTLLSGNDSIDLYYFGPAHTSGDAFVVFRNARVLAAGDAFANTAQPNIDLANGGSGVQYPETIAKAAAAIRNVDYVIGGHNPNIVKQQDLADYAEFLRLMVAKARTAVAANKTPEQAMMEFQAEIPAKFKTYGLGPGRGGPGGSFVQLFEELRKQ